MNSYNITIDQMAKKLWDYHLMGQTLQKSDCIIVLGSLDLRVAERGVELFLEGWAPIILMSGGFGRLTHTAWSKPEAEMFSDVAIKKGIPRDKILIENKSSNTGENIRFSYENLKQNNINPKKIILVQKPYMERRAWATFKKQWPEKNSKAIVTSPQISFEDYPNQNLSKEKMINILVGDTQRIKLYSDNGFIIPQEIPTDVWESFEKLVKLGFDKQLIKD